MKIWDSVYVWSKQQLIQSWTPGIKICWLKYRPGKVVKKMINISWANIKTENSFYKSNHTVWLLLTLSVIAAASFWIILRSLLKLSSQFIIWRSHLDFPVELTRQLVVVFLDSSTNNIVQKLSTINLKASLFC